MKIDTIDDALYEYRKGSFNDDFVLENLGYMLLKVSLILDVITIQQ